MILIQIVWIECICEDESLVLKNIIESKINGPDYIGIPYEVALNDFYERIKNYQLFYESI